MSSAGCKPHEELVVDVACQTVCSCFDEDQLDSCITECHAELDPDTTNYSARGGAEQIAWSCEVAAGRTTRFDLDLTAR